MGVIRDIWEEAVNRALDVFFERGALTSGEVFEAFLCLSIEVLRTLLETAKDHPYVRKEEWERLAKDVERVLKGLEYLLGEIEMDVLLKEDRDLWEAIVYGEE